MAKNERKLTPAEQKRKEQFALVCEEMERQGYRSHHRRSKGEPFGAYRHAAVCRTLRSRCSIPRFIPLDGRIDVAFRFSLIPSCNAASYRSP